MSGWKNIKPEVRGKIIHKAIEYCLQYHDLKAFFYFEPWMNSVAESYKCYEQSPPLSCEEVIEVLNIGIFVGCFLSEYTVSINRIEENEIAKEHYEQHRIIRPDVVATDKLGEEVKIDWKTGNYNEENLLKTMSSYSENFTKETWVVYVDLGCAFSVDKENKKPQKFLDWSYTFAQRKYLYPPDFATATDMTSKTHPNEYMIMKLQNSNNTNTTDNHTIKHEFEGKIINILDNKRKGKINHNWFTYCIDARLSFDEIYQVFFEKFKKLDPTQIKMYREEEKTAKQNVKKHPGTEEANENQKVYVLIHTKKPWKTYFRGFTYISNKDEKSFDALLAIDDLTKADFETAYNEALLKHCYNVAELIDSEESKQSIQKIEDKPLIKKEAQIPKKWQELIAAGDNETEKLKLLLNSKQSLTHLKVMRENVEIGLSGLKELPEFKWNFPEWRPKKVKSSEIIISKDMPYHKERKKIAIGGPRKKEEDDTEEELIDDLLYSWFKKYCLDEKNLFTKGGRRKALVLYSRERGLGKTSFAKHLVGNIEDYYIICRGAFNSLDFVTKPKAKLLIIDDMQYGGSKAAETWKALVVSEGVNIREAYTNYHFKHGLPTIITTNDPKFFKLLMTNKDFKYECYFYATTKYLGPPGTDKRAERKVVTNVTPNLINVDTMRCDEEEVDDHYTYVSSSLPVSRRVSGGLSHKNDVNGLRGMFPSKQVKKLQNDEKHLNMFALEEKLKNLAGTSLNTEGPASS